MKNACLKINFASTIVSLSTITVYQYLDSQNAWKTDSHVKVNVEAVSTKYAKISASINTTIVFLCSANKIAIMLEINALDHVMQNAFPKTNFAWIIVDLSTIIVCLF